MKARELAAILRELEKHPRIASIAVGDLRVTFRDASRPDEYREAEPDGDQDGPQELPDGVFDPRRAIERLYAKHRKPPEGEPS